jgi:CHAT domain-containing protein/ketosteroid isomerase-like protein
LQLAAYLLVGILLSASAQTDSQITVRGLIEKFFAAYQSGDLEASMSLWSEKSPDFAASKQDFKQLLADHKIAVSNLNFDKTAVEADKATVQFTIEVRAVNARTGKLADGFGRMNRTMWLVKEAEGWKIWKYTASEEALAADLIAAQTPQAQQALLEANPAWVTIQLVRALSKQGVRLNNQGRYTQALTVYRLADEIAGRLGDKVGSVDVLNGLARIYAQNDNARALEYLQKALQLAREIGDKDRIARSLNGIGLVFSRQGNNTQALLYYQDSVKLFEELGDKVRYAGALSNIALILHAQGDYAQALESYQKALIIARELNDKEKIGGILTNQGRIFHSQGNYAQALQHHQQALKFAEEADAKELITQTLNNIATIYHDQGDYAQALELYQKSLKLAEALGSKQRVGSLLNNIGLILESQGNQAQALDYYQKSLKLGQELGAKTQIADRLNNIGGLHQERGEYVQALANYSQGLKLAEESGEMEAVIVFLYEIASVYELTGKYSESVELADRAAVMASQIGNPERFWKARTVAGKAYRRMNKPEQARKNFDEAIVAIESIRDQVAGGEREQAQFFEDKLSPYQDMVNLLVGQAQNAAALAYAERAKARVLLDVLRSGRANITKAMTNDEIKQDRALASEITSLNQQLARQKQSGKPDTPQLAALNARLEKARLEYESFQTSLYVSHPELKVQRGQTQPLALEQTAELLSDNQTALLEYVMAENKSYLFVITQSAQTTESTQTPLLLKVYPINIKGKELAEMAEAFRQKVAERDLTVKKPAQQLYDLLVRPAESQLQGIRKLCIVPDGALWNLPFQALHQGASGYLLERFAIFYAPSLSVLREMIRRGNQAKAIRRKPAPITASARHVALASEITVPELLAVGNPTLSGELMTKMHSTYRNETLGPLPDAEKEVNILRQLYGPARSKVLIGTQAREEMVKAEAGKYAVLHLATHAILDDNSPMYSRIMLSPAEGDTQEDGMLEAWELMRLDLSAQLVVLSACQTARGRVAAGEGIIGMSWALFVAGSPAVLVSQWKVDSARSAELMVEFHRNLLSKTSGNRRAMTKSEALRQAALKLLRGPFNHPAYWAGFILIGDEQ